MSALQILRIKEASRSWCPLQNKKKTNEWDKMNVMNMIVLFLHEMVLGASFLRNMDYIRECDPIFAVWHLPINFIVQPMASSPVASIQTATSRHLTGHGRRIINRHNPSGLITAFELVLLNHHLKFNTTTTITTVNATQFHANRLALDFSLSWVNITHNINIWKSLFWQRTIWRFTFFHSLTHASFNMKMVDQTGKSLE